MNKHRNAKEMVATRIKSTVRSCSTPERVSESPSRDSDSICDSEAASPVPFLCTQDGSEGDTDVVWNFYTPKSENTAKSRLKNTTPLSRRSKRLIKPKVVEKQLPKRRALRDPHKKTELFQDLIELNQNLHELIAKKSQKCTEKLHSGSEEDVFNESPEYSPKSALRSNSRCLRRNVLSSNFTKAEPEPALESDDSMNECLIKASQVIEEKLFNAPANKRPCYDTNNRTLKTDFAFKMDQDSMDAILNSIKLDSPIISKVKKVDSPKLNNDSFDSLVGNMNDSALDRLTQAPEVIKHRNDMNSSKSNWNIKDLVSNDSPSSKTLFGRHNSMPESPTVCNNKPSTSGMVFGRFSSMPFGNDTEKASDLGDSPIRCTPDEIKKKHQLAREKLMAKRLLPFTATQKSTQPTLTQASQLPRIEESTKKPETFSKKAQFQLRVPTNTGTQLKSKPAEAYQSKTNNGDMKSLIEKKRQEALMKLRRRQIQTK